MYWISRGLIALLLLVALLLGATLLLPGDYRIERQRIIAAPVETIFAEIEDLRRWPNWTAWSAREPEMRIRYEGDGVGARQFWQGKDGDGILTITESRYPDLLRYSMVLEDWSNVSNGELSLTAVEGGTRVRWVFSGDFGDSLLMRWMGLMFDGWVGPDFEEGLERLATKVERAG